MMLYKSHRKEIVPCLCFIRETVEAAHLFFKSCFFPLSEMSSFGNF